MRMMMGMEWSVIHHLVIIQLILFNCFTSITGSQSPKDELKINESLRINQPLILLAWDPIIKPSYTVYPTAAAGTTGNYRWESKSSPSLSEISYTSGLIEAAKTTVVTRGLGDTIVIATDLHNSMIKDQIRISVQPVADIEIIGNILETRVGSNIYLPLAMYGFEDDARKVRRVFDDCSRIPVEVEVVETTRFEFIDSNQEEVPGFSRGCKTLKFKCNSVGHSRIFVKYTTENINLTTTTLISCHLPLKLVHPDPEGVIALGTSIEIAFEGGPRAWPLNISNHYTRLSPEKPEIFDLSLIADRYRYRKDLHVFRVFCKRLGESLLELTVGNLASATLKNPATEKQTTTIICAQPFSLFLKPKIKTDENCILNSRTIGVKVLVSNKDDIEIEIYAKDDFGRKFHNISSLKIDWKLSNNNLAKLGSPNNFIEEVNGAGGFRRWTRNYQKIQPNGKDEGDLVVTAKVASYQPGVIDTGKVNNIQASLNPIEASSSLTLVRKPIISPVIVKALKEGELVLKIHTESNSNDMNSVEEFIYLHIGSPIAPLAKPYVKASIGDFICFTSSILSADGRAGAWGIDGDPNTVVLDTYHGIALASKTGQVSIRYEAGEFNTVRSAVSIIVPSGIEFEASNLHYLTNSFIQDEIVPIRINKPTPYHIIGSCSNEALELTTVLSKNLFSCSILFTETISIPSKSLASGEILASDIFNCHVQFNTKMKNYELTISLTDLAKADDQIKLDISSVDTKITVSAELVLQGSDISSFQFSPAKLTVPFYPAFNVPVDEIVLTNLSPSGVLTVTGSQNIIESLLVMPTKEETKQIFDIYPMEGARSIASSKNQFNINIEIKQVNSLRQVENDKPFQIRIWTPITRQSKLINIKLRWQDEAPSCPKFDTPDPPPKIISAPKLSPLTVLIDYLMECYQIVISCIVTCTIMLVAYSYIIRKQTQTISDTSANNLGTSNTTFHSPSFSRENILGSSPSQSQDASTASIQTPTRLSPLQSPMRSERRLPGRQLWTQRNN